MNKHLQLWIVGAVAIATLSVLIYVGTSRPPLSPPVVEIKRPFATVSYYCGDRGQVSASYFVGERVPVSAGQRPVPTGSVELRMSDGTTTTLLATISASGARYANADETFVFWNKGRSAHMERGDGEYVECIEVAPDVGWLSEVYASTSLGVSVRYPEGYTIQDTYFYQMSGKHHDIAGIMFTIPERMATGTNLGHDSSMSIEWQHVNGECLANNFFDEETSPVAYSDGDMAYSVASTTGAGAGNRYEETVYALTGSEPCTAVRYFVHHMAIENYPEGAVQSFDKEALLAQFDSIRHSLVVIPRFGM